LSLGDQISEMEKLTALNRSKTTFPAPSSPKGFTLRLSHLLELCYRSSQA